MSQPNENQPPKKNDGKPMPADGAPDIDGPIFEIEKHIEELEVLSKKHKVDFGENIAMLKQQQEEIVKTLIENLPPWDRVCMARHRDRPIASDYIRNMCSNFIELHGDRSFADDRAMVTGLGTIDGRKVMIVANEKGHGVKEKQIRNFGMAHPEGYRKARHKMELGERLRIPILTIIDTQGAFPGIGAEERGQAMAIAENLAVMARLRTPILSIIIGEGGSGGALGIGVADRIIAQENSYFSVITPEGCSAILWKSADKRQEAAESLRLDPKSLMEMSIIDEIVKEPLGGAHKDALEAAELAKAVLIRNLDELRKTPLDELLESRYYKYRKIGSIVEGMDF